jgi:hypothetical protein
MRFFSKSRDITDPLAAPKGMYVQGETQGSTD